MSTDPYAPHKALSIARSAVIAMLVLIMVSPPLANLAQAVLIVLVLGVPDLRRRLVQAAKQPMVMGSLLFAAILVGAAIYGEAPASTSLESLSGWRKILLLPIVAALFDDHRWKVRLLHIFIVAAVVLAVVSTLLMAFGASVPGKPPGIVVRNHSTQGLMFALAAFSAFILADGSDSKARGITLRAAAFVLVFNIVVVTPGKSGYLALLVFSAVGALYLLRNATLWRRVVIGSGAVAVMALFLALSPQSRAKIQQGIDEALEYRREVAVSSMGQRVYFWRNTIELIRLHPILGVGTGGFEGAYSNFVQGRTGMDGIVTGDPHNQYLKFAAEQGLLGLAVFLAFLISVFRQRVDARFYALGIGALLVWCCTSLANAHFSTFTEGSVIFAWLGAMLADDAAETGRLTSPS